MRITRKQLRRLIEIYSRQAKVDFVNKTKSRHPSIDQAYFVHWFGAPNCGDKKSFDLHLGEINRFINRKGQETSANILDPTGLNVTPHYMEEGIFQGWGPIGIVFQGIVTYGSTSDTMSMRQQTPSGLRIRPDETHGDYVTDTDAIYKTDSFPGYDKKDPDTFLKHAEDLQYNMTEFVVVVKKIHGIVYHTQSSLQVGSPNSCGDQLALASPNVFKNPGYITNRLKNTFQGLPVYAGSQVNLFVKSLYSSS